MIRQLWFSIKLRICLALAGRYPALCKEGGDVWLRWLYHFNLTKMS
jgi:hypothetical protein